MLEVGPAGAVAFIEALIAVRGPRNLWIIASAILYGLVLQAMLVLFLC